MTKPKASKSSKKSLADLDARCPMCAVRMEAGFIIDRQHYSTPSLPEWAEGEPDVGFLGAIKVGRMKKRVVSTYRCLKCGLLQSYAP